MNDSLTNFGIFTRINIRPAHIQTRPISFENLAETQSLHVGAPIITPRSHNQKLLTA